MEISALYMWTLLEPHRHLYFWGQDRFFGNSVPGVSFLWTRFSQTLVSIRCCVIVCMYINSMCMYVCVVALKVKKASGTKIEDCRPKKTLKTLHAWHIAHSTHETRHISHTRDKRDTGSWRDNIGRNRKGCNVGGAGTLNHTKEIYLIFELGIEVDSIPV